MTPEDIQARLDRRGGVKHISEIAELWIAKKWYQLCDHRLANNEPLPPDHLRPRLADPQPEQSKGDTPA